MKWNESGFRPPLCTYRLNWARRTSWGWWDEWDDTFLQTQDSKFEPWRSEAEHATSRSRRLSTILTFTRGRGRNNFVSLKPPTPWTEPHALACKAAVLTTTLGPPPYKTVRPKSVCNEEEQGKHDTFRQCWLQVGPSPVTLAQSKTNIGWIYRGCWVVGSLPHSGDVDIKLAFTPTWRCFNAGPAS